MHKAVKGLINLKFSGKVIGIHCCSSGASITPPAVGDTTTTSSMVVIDVGQSFTNLACYVTDTKIFPKTRPLGEFDKNKKGNASRGSYI